MIVPESCNGTEEWHVWLHPLECHVFDKKESAEWFAHAAEARPGSARIVRVVRYTTTPMLVTETATNEGKAKR